MNNVSKEIKKFYVNSIMRRRLTLGAQIMTDTGVWKISALPNGNMGIVEIEQNGIEKKLGAFKAKERMLKPEFMLDKECRKCNSREGEMQYERSERRIYECPKCGCNWSLLIN